MPTALVAAPAPTLFTACTSKRYSVPLVRPDTVKVVSSAALPPESEPSGTSVQLGVQAVVPVRWARYWYFKMAAPPSLPGAVQASVTRPSPGVVPRSRGAPGADVPGALVRPDPGGSDHPESPSALVARTRAS